MNFRARLIKERRSPVLSWKLLATKAYRCQRLLSCHILKCSGWTWWNWVFIKSKPNSNLISNKTFGEWAEQPYMLCLRELIPAFFFYGVAWIQIQLEVTKKLVGRAGWNVSHSRQIFVLSPVASGHNRRIIRPSGGMEWGKLAASAPSVLGKNRSTEIFPSFMKRCRTLLTSGASKAGQDQCLVGSCKASCIIVATTVNSHEIWDSC